MISSLSSSLSQQLFGSSSDDANDYFSNAASNMKKYGMMTSNAKALSTSLSTLGKVTNPVVKIRMAYQAANTIKIQTDALTTTGNATRIASLTDQASQVMDSIQSSVSTLSQISNGIKNSKTSISSALSTMHDIMTQLKQLSGKLSSADAASITSTLQTMDQEAAAAAKTAGLKWTSVTGAANSSSSGSSSSTSASTTSTSLVDYLI